MWWDNNIHDELESLIHSLPESLIGSFCTQIKYLDSSEKVREFVGRLCEKCSPFGQAELLLSKKGSRLFRALVEVNPAVTSDLLFRVFSSLSDKEISDIKGDVRRNFVWALEMLIFHKSCFEKSAWCLFKLAQFENENYSNNALGQFSQLFRLQLSGTEADFDQRLNIINKAFSLDKENADVVIIGAISNSMSTSGFTRTRGAEIQGTKPELKEWHPKKYQEIYDYWQSLLGILLQIIERGHLVEKVKEAFGHEIRGLIKYDIAKQLDCFIKQTIELTDKYWPSAAQSIIHALQFDAKGMNQEQIDFLRSWEKLLSPDESNIEEKLKLIVLNPSRDHVKGDDGRYIDMAAEDAKKLSSELKGNHAEIVKHFELLMTFPEQKQSWVFAKYLVIESEDYEFLLAELFDYFRKNKNANTQFFAGFLNGLYIKNSNEWLKAIELIGADESLVQYYPISICTGKIEPSHLNTLVDLIKNNQLSSASTLMLAYGSVTDNLKEDEIAQFCMSLSKIDPTGVWVALDIVNMYTHGRDDIQFNKLTPALTHLVLNASFKKEDKARYSDSYHWLNSVERLLKSEDAGFAFDLCLHIIDQVGKNEVDYSDLWDYLSDAFYKAFELHGNDIWPKIADKFIDGNVIKPYSLIDLLGSGKSYKERNKSVFDILESDVVVNWCRDEIALLIVARAISMFTSDGEERVVNPLMIQLLAEFSDCKPFLNEISANFESRSWSGSLVPYLEADKRILQPLMNHANIKVRNWAIGFIENIDHQIKYEEKRDAEEQMLRS
ncbi:hypothetical protein CWC30_02730 [Pseudoalteromonas sp. S4741]|nr:hypothetical protein CWC30_02730 [Pseudoalteromonas sp. S4741]